MNVTYKEINEAEKKIILEKFGDYVLKYNCLHFGEGCFTLGAFNKEEIIGFISTYPKELIDPLKGIKDAYIDVIEVDGNYRRLGIATELITRTEKWSNSYGYKQIRAWSSEDKIEAINMWYSLNYCLCPAIMYGVNLKPNPNDRQPVGYYVVKSLNKK